MHVHFVVAVHFDMESFHFFARLEKDIMATWFKPISLQDILILIFYDLSYVKTMLSFPFGSKNVHIFLIITRVAIVLFVVKSGLWGKVVFRSSSYFTRVIGTRLTLLYLKVYILVYILVSTNRLFIELDRQAANQIRRPEWWIEFGRVVSLLEPLTIDP